MPAVSVKPPTPAVNPRLRLGLAVLCGAVVAFLIVAVIEALGHFFYPPPPLDLRRPELLRAQMLALPLGAFLWVLAAWVLASFCGAVVASLVARRRLLLVAAVVSALLMVAVLATLVSIPHPVWFVVSSLVAVPAVAYVAAGVAQGLIARRG